jgi:hypothetical protein
MKPYWYAKLILYSLVALVLAACNLPRPTVSSVGIPTLDATAIIQTAYARLTNQPIPPSGNVDTVEAPSATPGEMAGTPTLDIHIPLAASATASVTPAAAASPTQGTPLAHASLNTNCRSGPGLVYPIVGYLVVGEPAEVVGRYPGDAWWVIQHPTRPDRTCWVWSQTTMVTGDIAGLPLVQAPPTPIPTKIPTRTPTPSFRALPTDTETPAFPETPTSTDLPASTDTPSPTDTPSATEIPTSTEPPASTALPTDPPPTDPPPTDPPPPASTETPTDQPPPPVTDTPGP